MSHFLFQWTKTLRIIIIRLWNVFLNSLKRVFYVYMLFGHLFYSNVLKQRQKELLPRQENGQIYSGKIVTYPSESGKLINYRDSGKITGSVTGIRVRLCRNNSWKIQTFLWLNEGAAVKGLNKLKYDAHNSHIDNPMREYWMRLYRRQCAICKIQSMCGAILAAQSEGDGWTIP